MKPQFWLVKQEPDKYSWDNFIEDKHTIWDGVRNYQARNNLKAMRIGDTVLFYASVETKAVMGIAEVTKTAFPDKTADEEGWVAVELKAIKGLSRPVTLAQIKQEASLSTIALVRNSRLSVSSLTHEQYNRILALSKKNT
jgi:predicted RNA-binding protein with PUA-like domain